MKHILSVCILAIIAGIVTSCKEEDDIPYGTPMVCISFTVEDDRGIDITDSIFQYGIECYNKNGKETDYLFPRHQFIRMVDVDDVSELEDLSYKCSGVMRSLEFIENHFIVCDFLGATDLDLKCYVRIMMCENDPKPLILTLTEEWVDKDPYYYAQWEYYGIKIPRSNHKLTYCTFIRHNDGTYTLKE